MHFRILKMIATSGFLTAYSAPPDLVAGIKGALLPKGKGGEGEGEAREGKGWKRKEGEGRPLRKFLDPPVE